MSGKFFAVGCLKRALPSDMLRILFGLHMEVNSIISFQTCLNTCSQNRFMEVVDSYETNMV